MLLKFNKYYIISLSKVIVWMEVLMESIKGLENKVKNKRSDAEMEEITIRIIKFMLKEGVPLKDIQHLSKKSIKEIKQIGGLTE